MDQLLELDCCYTPPTDTCALTQGTFTFGSCPPFPGPFVPPPPCLSNERLYTCIFPYMLRCPTRVYSSSCISKVFYRDSSSTLLSDGLGSRLQDHPKHRMAKTWPAEPKAWHGMDLTLILLCKSQKYGLAYHGRKGDRAFSFGIWECDLHCLTMSPSFANHPSRSMPSGLESGFHDDHGFLQFPDSHNPDN